MKNLEAIFIALWFYVGWFLCVFFAKTESSIASLLSPLFLIGYLIFKSRFDLNEVKSALVIVLSGFLFDGLMIYFGKVTVIQDSFFPVPIWLISMWLLFSVSIVKLGSKFNTPLWLASILGAVMGPLSYKSGEFFQVLSFTANNTFVIYAIFWAIAFPIFLRLVKRNQGMIK